jgi:hypothetical protein
MTTQATTKPARETARFINSRVTASKSLVASKTVLRSSTTMSSFSGDKVVFIVFWESGVLGFRSAIRSFLNYLNGNCQFGDFVHDKQLRRTPEISIKA